MPIVYQRSTGGISVCVPCISVDDPQGFTIEQAYQRALNKDIPIDAINVLRFADGILPTNDMFRNAWLAVDVQGNITYGGKEAYSVVDANLRAEMQSYITQLNLLTNLGRSTTTVQANISDCQSRAKQLDALVIPDIADAATLATLKSLIKAPVSQ